MLCFLVLMQNGEGLMDKAPSYITEKTYMLRSGYEAFAALDIYNMRKVADWCKRWHVEMPQVCAEELARQEEAFENVKDIFEAPFRIRHYNDPHEETRDL